jgi:hypothetical protein
VNPLAKERIATNPAACGSIRFHCRMKLELSLQSIVGQPLRRGPYVVAKGGLARPGRMYKY